MPPTQRISRETWKHHKADIVRLYIDEDQSIKSIQKVLNELGVPASVPQLQRQVREWKLNKNITEVEWNSLSRKIERRRAQGKATAIYLNDKQLPPAKVRKELSRNVRLTAALRPTAPSPIMRHVRVSTPVASTPSVTDLTPIPTIQMEQQGLALQVCSYEPRDHRPAGSAYPVALAGRSFVFINDLPYFFLSRKLESIGTSWVDQIWENSSGVTIFELGFRYQHFVMGFLNQLSPQNRTYCPPGIISSRHSFMVGRFLDSHIPSQYKGEVANTVRELLSFDRSPTKAYLQLIKITVCLVSNNLLPRKWETVAESEAKDPLIAFFRWINAEHHMWLLLQLLDVPLLGFDIMAERLLVFAARFGDEQLLGQVLEKNIDVNVPAWTCGKISMTALHEAVRCQNASIVQQLLKNGACVDGSPRTDPWLNPVTPLGLLLHPVQNARYATYGLGSINLGIVETLLHAGAKVDEADELTRLTILQKSIDLGLDELTYLILDHRPLTKNSFTISDRIVRETLLQTASRKNSITLVQRLLELDSQALELDRSSRMRYIDSGNLSTRLISPEQYAVRNKNVGMLHLLLKHGAELDPVSSELSSDEVISRRGYDGKDPWESFAINAFSPLQEATKEADMDLLIYLLDLGANINNSQFPALPIAAGNGDSRLCRFLCTKGADVNLVPTRCINPTALQAAASSGNIDTLRLFISLGVDVNEPPRSRELGTALQLAVESQSLPAIELLLEEGADVNVATTYFWGKSALQRAVEVQNEELVVSLLNVGADVNYRDLGDQSILLTALCSKSLKIVDTLLTAGATHSPSDLRFHYLYDRESLQTLEAILNAEEELNRKYKHISLEGVLKDLLNHHAERNMSMDICYVAAFLLSTEPRYFDSTGIRNILHCAIAERNVKIVNILLQAGTDLKKASGALISAGRSGSVALVRGCIMAGIDIDTQDTWRQTALGLASEFGHLEVVQLLLDLGAKVDGPSTSDMISTTALPSAALSGHFHIVVLLLSAGADINAAGGPGVFTALEAAATYGRLDIAYLLMQSNQDLGKLKADCRRAALLAQEANHCVLAKELSRQYARLDSQGIEEDNSVVPGRLRRFKHVYRKRDWGLVSSA